MLVEGVRQRRHHHVGNTADRLPVHWAGLSGVRTTRLPTGGVVLLVHLFAVASPLSLYSAAVAGAVAGSPRTAHRSGRRLGLDRRGRSPRPAVQELPGKGWFRPGALG